MPVEQFIREIAMNVVAIIVVITICAITFKVLTTPSEKK